LPFSGTMYHCVRLRQKRTDREFYSLYPTVA